MSAAKKVAVIDDPVGQVGMQFASARHVAQQPKLRITLYPSYGNPEVYEDCTVLSGLMPELEFKGTVTDTSWAAVTVRSVHVASTTLPYKIEALTDVIN